jgi:NYN domain
VVYFTARVKNDPDAALRQSTYLDALSAYCRHVYRVEGRFQQKPRVCNSCGASWIEYEEKETDVNIATALIEDAVEDRYDTAILVSGDSDLRPAVAAVKRLRPGKRIIAAFPQVAIPGSWCEPLMPTSPLATPQSATRSFLPWSSQRVG